MLAFDRSWRADVDADSLVSGWGFASSGAQLDSPGSRATVGPAAPFPDGLDSTGFIVARYGIVPATTLEDFAGAHPTPGGSDMRRRFALSCLPFATLLLSFGGCGPAGTGDAVDAEPETASTEPPPFETTRVADGVWQFRWQGHNALFIDTPEGTIAVDPISTEAAATFAEEIVATVGQQPLLAVVYSHRDADHASGAQVLRQALGPDAPIVAHENALELLAEAADPDLPAPTVTYDDMMTLAEGSRPVELHHPGPSHSDDQSVVVIPDVGVAFAVDFVAADRVGYQELPGWHMPGQIQAIEALLELDYETIVFGHGPTGDRATIERQLAYYQALRDAVSEAIAEGQSADEAAASIRLDEFAGWGQYDDWFPLNVRGMYRLLTEG